MALNATFRAGTLGYSNTIATDASGSTVDTLGPITLSLLLSDGTGAGQANRAFRDYRTLTSASLTYTLSALAGSQSMAKVKLLFVQVTTDSTGSLVIAPGTTNGWTGLSVAVPLVAGSIVVLTWPTAAGAAAGAAATDQIKFTATGAVTYTACFVGTNV